MRRAAMAFARALTGHGRSAPFEPLEGRALLSVPVISGQFMDASVERLTFRVHFAAGSASDPVNPGQISVGVTGPNGFSEVLQPYRSGGYWDWPQQTWVSDGAGGWYGAYVATSPQHFFDNGTYTIGVAAGAVRTQHGDTNAEAGGGQYWLWFPDTAYGQVGENLTVTNELVSFWRRDRNAPDLSNPVNINTIELVRPDGTVSTASMPSTGSRVYANGAVAFGAPDGAWDFTDNGSYVVQVPRFSNGVRVGSVVIAQYWHYFGPRAELVSSHFDNYQWNVTIRYTDETGVDLTTINDYNATFLFAADRNAFGAPLVSGRGHLAGTPILNPDQSVLATYNYFTGPQGFTAAFNGTAQVAIEGVRGRAQDLMWKRDVDTRQLNFTNPAIVSVDGSSVTSRSWAITLGIGLPYTQNFSFAAGNLRIEGPGGSLLTPTAVGTPQLDGSGVYHVTYTLTLPAGQRLANGQYRVFLNAGAFTIGSQSSSEVFVGSWWFWF